MRYSSEPFSNLWPGETLRSSTKPEAGAVIKMSWVNWRVRLISSS